jgi:hypothetical protein
MIVAALAEIPGDAVGSLGSQAASVHDE